jgi:hypothetical protein
MQSMRQIRLRGLPNPEVVSSVVARGHLQGHPSDTRSPRGSLAASGARRVPVTMIAAPTGTQPTLDDFGNLLARAAGRILMSWCGLMVYTTVKLLQITMMIVQPR